MKKEHLILIFAVFAAFAATAAFFYPALSSDAWWHISSGREIIKAKGLPAQDDFYCIGGNKWYAHEWLFDAGIFGLYSNFGERSIKPVFSFIFFLVLIVIFFTADRSARGSTTAAMTAALIACALLVPYTEERPQIITVAAMGIFMFAGTFKPGKNNIAGLYLLIPLTVLWTNIHSAAIAGVYVFAASWTCHLFTAPKNDRKFMLLHGSILLPLLFISVLISPLGLKAVMFFGEDAWLKQYINEWQGIISRGGLGQNIYAAALISAGAAGLYISARRLLDKQTRMQGLKELFIFVPFFAAVFITKKIIPLFIVAIVPVIASGLAAKNTKAPRVLTAVLFFVILIFSLAEREIVLYPDQAMEFIRLSGNSGCVLTSFEWGGYAENALYPAYRVFLNGRLNAPEDVIRKYSNIYNAEGDFGEFMKETGVRYYVLRHDSPLAHYLYDKNIKPVYSDRICLVFDRPQEKLLGKAN